MDDITFLSNLFTTSFPEILQRDEIHCKTNIFWLSQRQYFIDVDTGGQQQLATVKSTTWELEKTIAWLKIDSQTFKCWKVTDITATSPSNTVLVPEEDSVKNVLNGYQILHNHWNLVLSDIYKHSSHSQKGNEYKLFSYLL